MNDPVFVRQDLVPERTYCVFVLKKEQEFYASKQLSAPQRCKDCRAQRKNQRAAAHNLDPVRQPLRRPVAAERHPETGQRLEEGPARRGGIRRTAGWRPNPSFPAAPAGFPPAVS